MGKKRQTKKSLAASKNVKSRWQTGKSVGETKKARPTVDLAEAGSSSKKFKKFKDDENEINVELANPDYVLVYSEVWKEIFSSLTCADCGCQGLEAKFCDGQGFTSKVIIQCSSCSKVHVDTYTSPRITSESTRPPFDVNSKIVDAFLGIGKGHAAMQKFCMTMGMECMSSSTYNSHLLDRSKQSDLLQCELLSMAHRAVRCSQRRLKQRALSTLNTFKSAKKQLKVAKIKEEKPNS